MCGIPVQSTTVSVTGGAYFQYENVYLGFCCVQEFRLNWSNTVISTADGAPYDGAAREGLHQNSAALVSVYSVAASAGIMCAVVCLLFNIIFRNRK